MTSVSDLKLGDLKLETTCIRPSPKLHQLSISFALVPQIGGPPRPEAVGGPAKGLRFCWAWFSMQRSDPMNLIQFILA